jgi:hypothetical protein
VRGEAGIDLARVEHVLDGEPAHDQSGPPVPVERLSPLARPAGHLVGG